MSSFTPISLVIDSGGSPRIGYSDSLHSFLKIATPGETTWNITELTDLGTVGSYCAFTLDTSDRPKMSFTNRTTGYLTYADWTGSDWETSLVDTNSSIGYYQDLVLDRDGKPGIAYYDAIKKDLKYAVWDASGWEITRVDSFGDVGSYLSLERDFSGRPGISYADASNKLLKYAAWDGSSWKISIVDRNYTGGYHSSLALTKRDVPGIVYYATLEQKLKFAVWNGASWEYETVAPIETGGINYISLDFDSMDNPSISYYDENSDDLVYATKSGDAWVVSRVDETGNVGTFSSLSAGRGGKVMIAYLDTTGTHKVKFAESISPVIAAFSAGPQAGNSPLQVSFNDLSIGEPTSWEWYFGDGSTSTESNPVHTYTLPGTYTVYLKTSNAYYHNTTAKSQYITANPISPSITANFTGFPYRGQGIVTTFFSDQSLGGPKEWNWSFGDGQFSGDQNPVHTYINPGNYTVILSVLNGTASDQIVIPDLISVTAHETCGGDTISGGSGIAPESHKPSDLTFFVDSDYLEAHRVNPADVKLMSFTDKHWNELPTRFTGSQGNRFYYEADCDRYSLLFIGNRKDGYQQVPQIGILAMTNVTVLSESEIPTEPENTMLHKPIPSGTSPGLHQKSSQNESVNEEVAPRSTVSAYEPYQAYLLLGALFFMLVAGVFIVKRWWIRRQNPALFRDYD
jgi:PGF-pre-PGF domain-containing protein